MKDYQRIFTSLNSFYTGDSKMRTLANIEDPEENSAYRDISLESTLFPNSNKI